MPTRSPPRRARTARASKLLRRVRDLDNILSVSSTSSDWWIRPAQKCAGLFFGSARSMCPSRPEANAPGSPGDVALRNQKNALGSCGNPVTKRVSGRATPTDPRLEGFLEFSCCAAGGMAIGFLCLLHLLLWWISPRRKVRAFFFAAPQQGGSNGARRPWTRGVQPGRDPGGGGGSPGGGGGIVSPG